MYYLTIMKKNTKETEYQSNCTKMTGQKRRKSGSLRMFGQKRRVFMRRKQNWKRMMAWLLTAAMMAGNSSFPVLAQ